MLDDSGDLSKLLHEGIKVNCVMITCLIVYMLVVCKSYRLL
jgi:hypothetical protein